MSTSSFYHIAPDKGWTWLTLFAGCLGNIFVGGVLYSFGVFYLEFLDYFGGSRSATAWIGSIIGSLYALEGPLVSALSNKFGQGPVSVVGGIIVATGFVLCTFSKSIWTMIICYSIMGGVGFGFVYLCGFTVIGHSFDKKRPLALGALSCGSSLGGFMFAPLATFLINRYSWQGAMLIIAGIVLNDIVIGAIFHTFRPDSQRIIKIDSTKDNKHEGKKKKLLDLGVLKLPACSILCMVTFCHMLGFYVPFIYLPDFARGLGMDKQQGAYLLSIVGISNTIARALAGVISNTSFGDPLKISSSALIMGGIATMICPWLHSYTLLCVFSVFFGFSFGLATSVSAIILVEFVGPAKLSDAFGFLGAARGSATLIGTPLAGVLYDSTGSYFVAFMSAGGAIFLAGILCMPIRVVHNYFIKTNSSDASKESLDKDETAADFIIKSPDSKFNQKILHKNNHEFYGSQSSLKL